ncbi:hypothetical protein HPU229334_00270 [Helicobacter pullorum]|uniref:HipA-like C-terminal domain-containing protein n=1 Tax=Helicobacter pullorum TaxID=35818 RepID=A0A0N1E7F8_9HELI|nr:HipA domain-containing protein [Helicobacter pullorum]KPH54733.1 hypothetical protein HPU229334_00270 [Helicobacter pullorum]
METIYIFKQKALYGKIEQEKCFLFKNGIFEPNSKIIDEMIDILPEGIDLKIMLHTFNLKNPIELLPYLKNTIGDFSFSKSIESNNSIELVLSDLDLMYEFPNVLKATLDIDKEALNPNINSNASSNVIQRLSLSGYQHKLQISVIGGRIKQEYADFILKPAGDFCNLGINEHLNMSFMRELGFEVPYNGIVFDGENYHYLVKRFDIDNGNKIPQITLNALMQSKDKYSGSIEKICEFLNNRLDEEQKMLFLKYIYANALIYNNDLHKKNISFLYVDGKMKLSPAYDVINIFPIKGLANLQCVLPIKGKLDNIKISYFKEASNKIGLEFCKVEKELNGVLDIYLAEYPKYIQKLSELNSVFGIKEFKQKLLETYDRNVKNNRRTNLKNQKIENNLRRIL